MAEFTPLYGFKGFGRSYREPFPDSVVMDPFALVSALSSAPEPTRYQQDQFVDYVSWIQQRHQQKWPRLLYYRKEAMRPYGRILLNVLTALMIGRIDFRIRPDDGYYELAKEAFTRLFMRYMNPLIRTAVQDYFTTGLGGVSLTPMGLAPLRPENTFAYPSFFDPRYTIRLLVMEWDDAQKLFKHPALKETPPVGDPNEDEKDRKVLTLDGKPALVLLEKVDRQWIEYYYGNILLKRYRRLPGRGHFLLVGDPRDLDYTGDDLTTELPILEEEMANTDIFGGLTWVSERAAAYCELPVGLIEQLASHYVFGYNLLEAHQRLIEGIMLRTTRASVCSIRADLVNADDPNAQAFVNYYKPIITMGGEGAGPAVQFIDVVSLSELQAGLREIENQITAITGITPYMMGLSGVSDVASEIVVMQSQANARINHIHSYIVRWLGEVVDQFGLYLASVRPEYQEPLVAFDVSSGQKVVVGGAPDSNEVIPHISYEQLFGRYYIEPTLVGEITNINRRNELMQALQLTMQILPVLAQMGGQVYDVKAITDHILSTFNIDPGQITLQLQPQAPQQPVAAGAQASMPVQEAPGAAPEPTDARSSAIQPPGTV